MEDRREGSGLLRRGWLRVIDGDRPWGSIDIRPDRFGVTRYRLVVYPPGITESERRLVRVARGLAAVGRAGVVHLRGLAQPGDGTVGRSDRLDRRLRSEPVRCPSQWPVPHAPAFARWP